MRFSSSFFVTVLPLLLCAVSGTFAAPTAPADNEFDCFPITALDKRDFNEAQLERRGIAASATKIIQYMATNSAKMTRSPVFWTGRFNRKGARQVADIVKKDTKIVGSGGGFTVFDVVNELKVDTKDWKPATEWAPVCAAFAQYAQPASKKAVLVYGPITDQNLNIWNDHEWPKLKSNAHVAEVDTYKMKEDGRSVEAKVEIKKSGKGNIIKK
ncbi:hypothetical protein H0H87_008302 [Tephrocybe sp. NHM501043]|nr:hypothetical protein H0H87_008302 [Tephrocybe sp. NHM501043]